MSAGRTQTTKGIWMSKAKDSRILVMDVEGTDGRERGDDQDFERKSALFSLAIAEVVIINMWEHAVGLYNGANMSLLRTVMEVNLQLFDSKSKTLLCFVLRDSTGVAPLEQLSLSLQTDLEKIWTGISKPSGKENAKISDYFEFTFTLVAHKVYAADKFKADLESLHLQFYDSSRADYLLKPKYHKGVPADGFPVFAEAIWGKIVDNRDLDLPTQQQLLAQYRCDEIARVAYSTFLDQVKVVKSPLDGGKIVEEFGQVTSDAFNNSLAGFVKDGSRYHQETYKSKKKEFIQQMHAHLHVFFLQQLRNIHKKSIQIFRQSSNV
jgi:hypothetical protein